MRKFWDFCVILQIEFPFKIGYWKKRMRKSRKSRVLGQKRAENQDFPKFLLKMFTTQKNPALAQNLACLDHFWRIYGHLKVIFGPFLPPFSLIYYIGNSDDDSLPSHTSGQISWKPSKITQGILYTAGKQRKFSTL